MSTVRTLLVFQTGSRACALPLEKVQEVVPMAELGRPPGLPSILEGFLDLRGAAVPVLRLARIFRLEDRPPGLYTPLVILRGGDHPVGLLVDRVTGVYSAADSAFSPVLEKHCFNDCAEAEVVVEGHGGPVHVLVSERLLLQEEQRRITELQRTAQQHVADLEGRAP